MFNPKQSEKRPPSLMELPDNGSVFIYSNYNYQHSPAFEMSSHTISPNHRYFRTTRVQNNSLKWKQNQHFKGNHKLSKHPYKKNSPANKKLNKSAEDVEEEERKKKLNDTAKKLLNKIKSWNAENNVKEVSKPKETSQQLMNQLSSECSVVMQSDGKSDSRKRIAHSKKTKFVKNRLPKVLKQTAKTSQKYDVNKASVKDFQNRIQHKLIEEIMQMPKENLQSVLNDPTINPIMGLKMSRLVQENRPLITQKLRAIAESKMESLGFTSSPQLLVDIDKLIDPVIETDLSALPYELIKKMENLFQVRFDYSQTSDSEVVTESSGQQQSELVENQQNNTFKEDLSLYECSTDEDEEIDTNDRTFFGDFVSAPPAEETRTEVSGIEDKSQVSLEMDIPVETTATNSLKEHEMESAITALAEEPTAPTLPSPVRLFSTACCQTDSNSADSSTQTTPQNVLLYGVPLPTESKTGTTSSLMEEVNAIQNLTNKLNERRLTIFLELFKMNPRGDFASDDRTRANLTETLSNGSVSLVDALQEFFKHRSNKSNKSFHFNSNEGNHRGTKKWRNRSKSRKGENR